MGVIALPFKGANRPSR